MKIFAAVVLCLVLQISFAQKKYESTWESIDSRPIPAWYQDAKFGIFIHWGVFSVPAWAPTKASVYEKYAEWYWWRLTDANSKTHQDFKDFHEKTYGANFKYPDFVHDFNCELFQPSDWAKLFKDAGAKYVVLTSKHHEGFTLWPSQHSWNWNAVDVGPHRDLAGDLTREVKKEGLHMGFYYSLYEWFNPLYKKDINRYVDDHMIPQMKDLVTRYSPDVVWTDGEWDHPSEVWKSTEFLAWLYNESPVKDQVVVNDRWGKETRSKHGGIYTTEYDLIHDQSSVGKKIMHPWEECRGIGGSFGYNRNESLEDYSTSEQLVHMLIDKVARGGNLLLNIGPTADGRIPVIMQQRLYDIGKWLEVNGEAIYGTRSWEKAPVVNAETEVYYTRKGNDLYMICRNYPEAAITIQNIKTPAKVTLLGYKGAVKTSSKAGVTIVPPALSPASQPCEFAWTFKLENVF